MVLRKDRRTQGQKLKKDKSGEKLLFEWYFLLTYINIYSRQAGVEAAGRLGVEASFSNFPAFLLLILYINY